MAGMRFIDIITDAEEVTQVTGERAFFKRLANNIQALICGIGEWPFLWTEDWFQTLAKHTTGNVDLTNASTTVSGGSTSPVFTSAMVGRKIRFANQTAYYTIAAFVSATEITLDQAYTGDTDTDVSYTIYKDEYLLRADVDQQKKIRQSENGIALFSLSASAFDNRYPIPTGEGDPALSVYIGRDVKTYTTGTVTVTNASRTIAGDSTAWTSAEGVSRGTKLKIGNLIFTVNSIASDTSLTVYEVPTAAQAAGTSYVALLNNPVVQLHSIPDEVQTYYYRFQRIPGVMDADDDIPEVPYPMQPLIGLGMLPMIWRRKGFMDRAVESQRQFEKELQVWLSRYQLPVMDRKHLIQPFSMRQSLAEAGWPAGTGVPLFTP